MKNDTKMTLLLPVMLGTPRDADTIMEFLDANPDLTMESNDDVKCEIFFKGLGMLNLFNVAKDPNLSVVTFRDHKTHWIVGLRWSLYPQPGQLEYRVFCLPKTLIREEDAQAFADSVIET